jgi:hypothetical protein
MTTCHEHNRSRARDETPRTFGIRLSLPDNDPMRTVLGEDWHEFLWFATEAARDAKIRQLTGPFDYYRAGDRPSFRIEKVNREAPAATA